MAGNVIEQRVKQGIIGASSAQIRADRRTGERVVARIALYNNERGVIHQVAGGQNRVAVVLEKSVSFTRNSTICKLKLKIIKDFIV